MIYEGLKKNGIVKDSELKILRTLIGTAAGISDVPAATLKRIKELQLLQIQLNTMQFWKKCVRMMDNRLKKLDKN